MANKKRMTNEEIVAAIATHFQAFQAHTQTLMKDIQHQIDNLSRFAPGMAQGQSPTDAPRAKAPKKAAAKKAPVKKAAAKKAPVRKKAVANKTATDKGDKTPAAEIVYDLIKKSKTGLAIGELIEATGFDQKKISNITFRLKQKGRIEKAGRGVYR